MDSKVIIVLGPTASGKTSLGVALARALNGEIISADSRQVYQGLDLGTGKDLDDFRTGGEVVPYHLIDVVPPDGEYHLFRYVIDAQKALVNIKARNKRAIIVGGTPLYLNALLDGYLMEECNPDLDYRQELEAKEDFELLRMLQERSTFYYERTDKKNRRRVIRSLEIIKTLGPVPTQNYSPLEALIIAPFFDRKVMHQRIEERLDARFQLGMIDEVQKLHDQGVSWERLDWFGLEYRYIAKYLQGEFSFSEMHDLLLFQIRKFCKRQDIWYRKMEREGKQIYWIPQGEFVPSLNLCQSWLLGEKLPIPKIRLNDVVYGLRN